MAKTIGIIHYKVGGTDGVSLEIEKWAQVLREMGHTVFLCAGDVGKTDATQFDSLYHHSPVAERLYRNTFVALTDYASPDEYRTELYRAAGDAATDLREFVQSKGIDFLVPQNVWSVAMNPAVAIAVAQIAAEFDLPVLAQHHDFYWERIDGVALTCQAALELADYYLPPRDAKIQHVVINQLAKDKLYCHKGIEATVIPNVFNFDDPPWPIDEYNADFRQNIGLNADDILILQATRIVPRKGIELAIDFVAALNQPHRRAALSAQRLFDGRTFGADNRIVLVLAGYSQDDATGSYVRRLKEKGERLGVELRFIENRISGSREEGAEKKRYTLWDTYAHADFVTYPSLWEGWGNQFLEALRAELPILLYEYPVFQSDIADKAFDVLSLGNEIISYDDADLAQVPPNLVEKAADRAVELLTDAVARRQSAAHNVALGRKHYSLDALRRYLGDFDSLQI